MVERKTDNLEAIGSSPLMPSKMIEYLPVFLYILFATGLGLIILYAAAKVRPRRLDLEKATAYECGFEPFGEARSPFDIGFYLVSILFLIFDIEVRFLLPWVLGGIPTGYRGFFRFVIF
jgi:NADH:ubiquinone oxidoreductase subunit 3 (subunit A)